MLHFVEPTGSTDCVCFATVGVNDPVTSALHIIIGEGVYTRQLFWFTNNNTTAIQNHWSAAKWHLFINFVIINIFFIICLTLFNVQHISSSSSPNFPSGIKISYLHIPCRRFSASGCVFGPPPNGAGALLCVSVGVRFLWGRPGREREASLDGPPQIWLLRCGRCIKEAKKPMQRWNDTYGVRGSEKNLPSPELTKCIVQKPTAIINVEPWYVIYLLIKCTL